MKKMRQLTIIVFLLIFLTPVLADNNPGKQSSLWRDQSFINSIYSDPKAQNVNDIVIIKVTESSSASNKAELSTSKKSKTSLGIDSFMGLEEDLKGKITTNFDPAAMFGGSTNNSNEGSGESSRETSLSTYIAARVVSVMPNRNLIIEAKKEIMVNKEKQIVVLKGIIRPRDLSYDNIIESSKIADLQINFSGKGPVSEQAKRGWLSWILNLIWPF